MYLQIFALSFSYILFSSFLFFFLFLTSSNSLNKNVELLKQIKSLFFGKNTHAILMHAFFFLVSYFVMHSCMYICFVECLSDGHHHLDATNVL